MRMYIYGLYDVHGRIRYIGKTENPAKRLKGHWNNRRRPGGNKANISGGNGDCERKNRWLATLTAPPELRVLVIVESEVVHSDGEFCREAMFMETLIKESAICEFGPRQVLNAKYWRPAK